MSRPPLPRPLPGRWPVGEDPFRLTLTANAGVLLQWGGCKVLIDALHTGYGQFSGVPAPMLADICAGRPPFDGVQGLAVTHRHADHWDPDWAARFLAARPGAFCLGPEDAGVHPLPGGAELLAFPVPHEGEPYAGVPHVCLLFTLGGRRVLFLGDAVMDASALCPALEEAAVDTAVVNPLFLNTPAGRAALAALAPEKAAAVHIPFAGDDTRRFREMAARSILRWREQLPPVQVLWDPLDQVLL